MEFIPDYRHFEEVMHNRHPARLPLYEHIICIQVMEQILGERFGGLAEGNESDKLEFFRKYTGFFKQMTYDIASFEICITSMLPAGGALLGGRPGPIQNRKDFENYPWDKLPDMFWVKAAPLFDALTHVMPSGMKAVGGIGNGVFEISEDMVGMEYLPFMQMDDPDLYADLFRKIGDLMSSIWRKFLLRYGKSFAACRFGDDLGFRNSLLTDPSTIRNHIIPQYRRIIDLVHAAKLPFIWHSCGCIFEIMDDVIALGINAKHSNEDAIAPFDSWVNKYGNQIGLLGGFDMDFLCTATPDEVFARVFEDGQRFRRLAKGYALGSGNSIPEYVPAENYMAMIKAAQHLRSMEISKC